jgi:hypothetical protein
MLRKRTLELTRDELGGGTVFGLLWFALLVGLCGLAIDGTNGFRNKTMLQATADSAALAGVMELPDSSASVVSAVDYAVLNMAPGYYGDVLQPADVEVGVWDEDTWTFLESGFPAGTPLDAVRVTTIQTSPRGNAVPVSFLRIIGLQNWDVRAMAVAQAFTPKCLRNGITAAGIVDISSNNGFTNRICIHGEQGVDIQSNNSFESGVEVTMGSLDDLSIPASGMNSNPGLAEALDETNKSPRLANHVDAIMADFLDPNSGIHPPYIDTSLPIQELNQSAKVEDLVPNSIHHVTCQAAAPFKIHNGSVLENVVIIADCELSLGADVFLHNVVLGSRTGGGNTGPNKSIIDFPAGGIIGLPDNCASGGGVQLFSNASMKFASSTTLNGVQMVAKGDVELGARDMGINGISIEAGGDVKMTSNNQFGLCAGGTPELGRFFYYRLVQ